MRIIIATLIVGAGLLTLSIAQAQQPARRSDPNFTGVVDGDGRQGHDRAAAGTSRPARARRGTATTRAS